MIPNDYMILLDTCGGATSQTIMCRHELVLSAGCCYTVASKDTERLERCKPLVLRGMPWVKSRGRMSGWILQMGMNIHQNLITSINQL